MADTVAHVVYLSNKDTGSDAPSVPTTDYLTIEPVQIGFVPDPTGNTQYLNQIVTASNGFIYAIDILGNAVQFSGVTGNVYQNGLTKTGGIVELGGTLLKATTVALGGFALNFSGSGNVTIGGTGGTERLTVKSGNVLIDDVDGELQQRSTDNTIWKDTVTNDGLRTRTDDTDTVVDMALMRSGTEATLLAIPTGSRVARQWYYCTDLDCYLYVRADKSYEYVNRTYTHTELAPASTWNVAHGMRRHPSVTVVDSAGTVMFGEVQYTDNNNIVIIFSTAIAGKAYLN
jgi:hypothetical protein